ncbi:MAG: hypothetical protein ACRCZW_13235 [Lactobacillaceae bacterium]
MKIRKDILMEKLMMIKDIHDYVKKKYEAGNYDNVKSAYDS